MKNKKSISETALAAKTIKKLLSVNFKNVKFSVTSEIFSGGDAVRISWSFGPTVDQVEEITNRFKGGYFDSMNDIYEYNSDKFEVSENGDVIKQPTVKYISTSRYFVTPGEKNVYNGQASKDAIKFLCEAFKVENHENTDLYENCTDYYSKAGNVSARLLRFASYPSDNIELTGLIRTLKDCGQIEEFYTYTFNDLSKIETPKAKKAVVAAVKVETVKVQTKRSFLSSILSFFTF